MINPKIPPLHTLEAAQPTINSLADVLQHLHHHAKVLYLQLVPAHTFLGPLLLLLLSPVPPLLVLCTPHPLFQIYLTILYGHLHLLQLPFLLVALRQHLTKPVHISFEPLPMVHHTAPLLAPLATRITRAFTIG